MRKLFTLLFVALFIVGGCSPLREVTPAADSIPVRPEAVSSESADSSSRTLSDDAYGNVEMLDLLDRAERKMRESPWIRIEESSTYGEQKLYTLIYHRLQDDKTWQGTADVFRKPEELSWSVSAISRDEFKLSLSDLRSFLKESPQLTWYIHDYDGRRAISIKHTFRYPNSDIAVVYHASFIFDVDEGCLLLLTHQSETPHINQLIRNTHYEYAEAMELPKAALNSGS